jgi:hypothetical protein
MNDQVIEYKQIRFLVKVLNEKHWAYGVLQLMNLYSGMLYT